MVKQTNADGEHLTGRSERTPERVQTSAKRMVVYTEASALDHTSLAMRKTLSPVRMARRARSTSPAPASSPGPLLCAELNMSHARGSKTPPAVKTSSSNEAENWMDKVMGMLHEVTGHGPDSGLVGPASLALPSLTPESKFQAPSPQLLYPRPSTPCQAQEVSPHVLRGNDRLYPILPTITTSARQNESEKQSKPPMKVVYDDRTCRAGCGPARDMVNTSEVPDSAKNRDFQLDSRFIPEVGDWRGPLGARRGSHVYKLASSVVATAYKMAIRESAQNKNILDRDWKPNGEALRELLADAMEDSDHDKTSIVQRQAEAITVLATYCKQVVQRQDILVETSAPVKVFGDVHGQLRDLLLLFGRYGFPTHKSGDIEIATYIFNGDFVDRGAHQLEVVLLLMAIKCLYPTRMYMVRGNHEFSDTSESQTESFKRNVSHLFITPQLGAKVYASIFDMFEFLPLAAIVCDKMLVLHGGLGDGSWCLDDLRAVQRPLKSAFMQIVRDIVWSDPSDSDSDMAKGVHGNVRGHDVATFGPDITKHFCEKEGIDVIVRSHQYVPEGYKVMHSGHLITLFSARDYLQQGLRNAVARHLSNNSALLLAAQDESGALRLRFKVLRAQASS